MAYQGQQIFKEIAGLVVLAGTPQAIWTPAAGKKFRLAGFHVGVSAACSVLFKEGAGNTSINVRSGLLGINGVVHADSLPGGVLAAAADNVLKIDATANATVHGFVWGSEE
jgi:hypothetical protein